MILSNAAIRRPVAMGCLIIGLSLLGLNSYRKMGLEFMPKIDAPFITVTTVYPGAAPEEIETDIAKRIEDTVVSVDGLKHVSSVCMENAAQILLEFQLDVDVDVAAMDVREQIDLIRSEFPEDAEDPQIQKFDINAKPIITLALTGDAPLEQLYDYADNTIKDRLTTTQGVADVELIGGAERQVRILANRSRLQARNLTTLDIYKAIQQNVRTIPSGRLQDRGTEFSVKFDADPENLDQISDLKIANRNGHECRVRDVATVEMGMGKLRKLAQVNARQAISLKIIKKADANAVKVTERVRDELKKANRSLPGGMNLVWVTDDGRFIEATIQSAWSDVAMGIVLTAAILFLFLYNWRALIVVSITMPLTIVIGLFFMQMLGFTLNAATLIAIGMSVGILVANSIVVLEAIVKRLDQGNPPQAAASLGAKETFVAVLASAGTNTVVLFPLAIMQTKIGMFIKPLALTMMIMTIVSLFISFTLTPMLCSILLRPANKDKPTLLDRLSAKWDNGMDCFIKAYQCILRFTERHIWAAVLVLLMIAAMFLHALSLVDDIGFGLISESDRGEVYVKLEFPTNYDLERTQQRVDQVDKQLKDMPHLRDRIVTIGKAEGTIGQTSEGVYLAQFLLRFNDRDQRDTPLTAVIKDIRDKLKDLPEAIVTVSKPSAIGGQSSPVQIEIAGKDLAKLDEQANQAEAIAETVDGLKDIDTTVRPGKPELRIRPDRALLSDRSIPATTVGMMLRANIEGLIAGTFKRNARNYDIVVQLKNRPGKEQVRQFQFPGLPGQPVSLETLITISQNRTPVQITRKDKRRVSKLYANLAPDMPLGIAVNRLSQRLSESMQLPPGYDITFAGDYEMMAEAQTGFQEAMLLSIILVILSLAAILESFRQPWLILVTLPLALIGVLWALYITNLSLDVFVIMGCVMMIGIVVNNAILIMDQFNVHIDEGVPRHKAMIAAACERFRPVIMTTVAAVLGMFPLAASRGIGAEIRNGIGTASVGGILVSGLLTLLVLPILYDLATRRKTKAPTKH